MTCKKIYRYNFFKKYTWYTICQHCSIHLQKQVKPNLTSCKKKECGPPLWKKMLHLRWRPRMAGSFNNDSSGEFGAELQWNIQQINSPEWSLLIFCYQQCNHSHSLAATLDFTSFSWPYWRPHFHLHFDYQYYHWW